MTPEIQKSMRNAVRDALHAFTGDDRPAINFLRGHIYSALDLAERVEAAAHAQRVNVMLPESGRRKVLADAVIPNCREVVALKTKITKELKNLADQRRQLEHLPVGPNDPASVALRVEARQRIRAMSAVEWDDAIRHLSFDATELEAIFEAPGSTGAPADVVEALRRKLVLAKGIDPDRMTRQEKQIGEIAESAIAAAIIAARDASDMRESDFDGRLRSVEIEMSMQGERKFSTMAELREQALADAKLVSA